MINETVEIVALIVFIWIVGVEMIILKLKNNDLEERINDLEEQLDCLRIENAKKDKRIIELKEGKMVLDDKKNKLNNKKNN